MPPSTSVLRPLETSSALSSASEVPPMKTTAAKASTSTTGVATAAADRAVAQPADHADPDQQRDEARLREAEDQPGEDHRQHAGADRDASRVAGPEHGGGHDHGDQRQVAPVDVRVPEERVDAEVEVEVVRELQRRVPEDLAGDRLADPDDREQDGLADDDREAQAEQRAASSRCRASSTNIAANGTRKNETFRVANPMSSE